MISLSCDAAISGSAGAVAEAVSLAAAGPGAAAGSPDALDVMFELFDEEPLIGDNAFHQIADRNDADEFLVFENREMAHGLCGHDGHAFLNRLIKPCVDDPR
jgi:hypothetical protein